MPRNRASQISLQDTLYYHCVSRCVRRGFLCGQDNYTGKCYEHRRQWVEDRLLLLAQVFAIDICAYAVMSNHTHVVLHVDTAEASGWSDDEVLLRYHRVYKGSRLTQQYCQPNGRELLSKAEEFTVKDTIAVFRSRLSDISWFMRSLNEYIARQANKEDDCTGRFWEGRFKSQALLDEAALLSCMAYVDLNPVRAKLSKTPETSSHTSVFHRALQAKNKLQPCFLMPFTSNTDQAKKHGLKGLSFDVIDYLKLVDITGKIIRQGNKGNIECQETILTRLGLDADNWITLTTGFEQQFSGAAGGEQVLKQFNNNQNIQKSHSMRQAKQLFGT